MKAVVARQVAEDFGQVVVEERPIPTPGPGQVRVRMRYAPINPSDLNYVHGTYGTAFERLIWNRGHEELTTDPDRQRPFPLPPYVLGGEGVGIVDAVGSGLLARRLLGKRVAVAVGPPEGTWQEQTLADPLKAIVVPKELDDRQAAMLFINPISTYVLLREVLRVGRGDWLLVTAAGSAIGKAIVRLRKKYGYRTICVVRSSAHTEALEALGADAVVETDSTDLVGEVARLTGGKGVSHALDCVGGDLVAQVARSLGLGAHLVCYGTLGAGSTKLVIRDIMMTTATVEGFYLPNWLSRQPPWKRLEVLMRTKSLVAEGFFAEPIHSVHPLGEVHEALGTATAAGRHGKVLLELG